MTIPATSLPPCTRHHYWTRLRAWVTGQQFFHACDVTWTSVTGKKLRLDIEDVYKGFPGDILIFPDPDFRSSDE